MFAYVSGSFRSISVAISQVWLLLMGHVMVSGHGRCCKCAEYTWCASSRVVLIGFSSCSCGMIVYVSGALWSILMAINNVWLLLMGHVMESGLRRWCKCAEYTRCASSRVVLTGFSSCFETCVVRSSPFGGHQQSLAIIDDGACDGMWTWPWLQMC